MNKVGNRSANAPGWIYLLRMGKLFKIGRSSNPEKRLKAITASGDTCHYAFTKKEIEKGHKPQLVHSFRVVNMHQAEQEIHYMFRKTNCMNPTLYGWRRRTEWFKLSSEDVEYICALTDQAKANIEYEVRKERKE